MIGVNRAGKCAHTLHSYVFVVTNRTTGLFFVGTNFEAIGTLLQRIFKFCTPRGNALCMERVDLRDRNQMCRREMML